MQSETKDRYERPLKVSAATEYTKIPKDYLEDASDMNSDVTVPCETCGRSFNEKRIKKHEEICRKAASGTERRGQFVQRRGTPSLDSKN